MDINIVNPSYSHSTTHRISYCLYTADTCNISDYHKAKDTDSVTEIKNVACFGSLWRQVEDAGANKIRFVTHKDKKTGVLNACPELTVDEVRNWIIIGRESGFLPDHVLFQKTEDHYIQRIILDLYKYPVSLTYFYLAYMRYIIEDTGVIKAFVYLTNECKLDPYTALVVANRFCCDYTGHSLLPYVRAYLEEMNNRSEIDLTLARALFLFITSPSKYDDRFFPATGGEFNLCNVIRVAKNDVLPLVLKVDDILQAKVSEFVCAKNEKDCKEIYTSLRYK